MIVWALIIWTTLVSVALALIAIANILDNRAAGAFFAECRANRKGFK